VHVDLCILSLEISLLLQLYGICKKVVEYGGSYHGVMDNEQSFEGNEQTL